MISRISNKGVTLVELLIVIIVMGLVAAFAIPSVGKIIDNTQKDAVYADALAVSNGMKLYCMQNECFPSGASQMVFVWGDVSPYISGLDETYYGLASGTFVGRIVKTRPSYPVVRLRAEVIGEYEWDTTTSPNDSTCDRSCVTENTE